jgi:hypothetical protein
MRARERERERQKKRKREERNCTRSLKTEIHSYGREGEEGVGRQTWRGEGNRRGGGEVDEPAGHTGRGHPTQRSAIHPP